MTVFFFDPDEFSIPALDELRNKWRNIPSDEIRNAVAVEDQYLYFHSYMLANLRYETSSGITGSLGFSTRAGAVKAQILLFGSIAEAVLRCHAERRNYPFVVGTRQRRANERTFGIVIDVWETNALTEITPVLADLKKIKEFRNFIHLSRAVADNQSWPDLLAEENDLLATGERVVKFLAQLISP